MAATKEPAEGEDEPDAKTDNPWAAADQRSTESVEEVEGEAEPAVEAQSEPEGAPEPADDELDPWADENPDPDVPAENTGDGEWSVPRAEAAPLLAPPPGPAGRTAATSLAFPRRAPDANASHEELRVRFDDASRVAGNPVLNVLGWAVFALGLVVLFYAYFDVYAANAETVLMLGGFLRYDVLGVFLMVVGGIMGPVFHFVPAKRPRGARLEDPAMDWLLRAGQLRGRVRTFRILAAVGWGVFLFGILVAALALRASWIASTSDDLVDFGMSSGASVILYWQIMLVLAVLGAILWVISYFRISGSREARQAYLLAVHEALQEADVRDGTVEGLPEGVGAGEIKRLMQRIDEIFTTIPESYVEQLAKSDDADTYLKLLDSAKS